MTHRGHSRHAAAILPLHRRLRAGLTVRRVALLPAVVLIGAALGTAAGVSLAAPAGAVTTGHNPIGHLDSVVDAGQSRIGVSGWAADPDALTAQMTILLTVDGAPAAYVVTNVRRPDVTAAVGAGPLAGFTGSLLVPAGTHQVCFSARNIGEGMSVSLGCGSTQVAGLPADQAAAHNPAGVLDSAAAPDTTSTTVAVRGWAIDPDAPSQPLAISATVDGRAVRLTDLAAVARPDVAAAKQSGPNQGFTFSTVIAVNGSHTLCVNAANVGPGAPAQISCAAVQVGPPPLTPAQIAAHSPAGALEAAAAVTGNSLQVRGWASDPDNLAAPVTVQAFIDGIAHSPVRAALPRPDLAGNSKAGPNPGYSFPMSVPIGAHNVCMWATNIGAGANQLLGCLTLATPGQAVPSGPAPVPPAVNLTIVATAKTLLGSKYVWGAEDPKVGFDCSGLAQYSYLSAKLSIPRVSQAQFSAARIISASRAVPGDLVFYHDSHGSVYHVGIYVSPGVTYAAVDPANGVRVQTIWDATATYGSFTHS